MSKKINCDNLYLAVSVYDYKIEIEPFVQYESFGKMEHRIIINPKKKLIYAKTDENGVKRFYDYKTHEHVFENSYESSFITHSSVMGGLYCRFINGRISVPRSLRNEFLRESRTVGYFIPFTEHVKEKLNLDVSSLTPSMIDKLMFLINIGVGRPFELSMSTGEAKLQLKKIGYRKRSKEVIKK